MDHKSSALRKWAKRIGFHEATRGKTSFYFGIIYSAGCIRGIYDLIQDLTFMTSPS